jgi:2-polyprenyl-6-methoxyphenol hydroxylase-like FAD-dependent oxidoreductase
MSNPTYDVVVVGAGPSGLTTAVPLARAGVRILLVEKHPGLSIFPKATGLRPRTMEILRSWGLEDEVVSRAQPAQLAVSVRPVLAAPGPVTPLGLPTEAELAGVSPSRVAVFPQDEFEAVLLADLLAHGAEVRFTTELVDLQADESEVRIELRRRDTGAVEQVTARYLVAADGSRSSIRDRLGITVEQLGAEGHHLSTLFRSDLSAVMPEVPFVLTITVAPGVEGVFAATGRSDSWFYDIEWHPESGETVADWPIERVAARVRAASGLPDLDLEVAGVFPWDFGASVATRQRAGRVFLVGDAAHRTTPRGATGMNTGIADGHNLGWKLAWVTRGWAAPSLLDSYEPERAPVGRANAEASLRTGMGADGAHAVIQDFGIAYRSGAALAGHDLAGLRAPHAWVEVDGRTVSTLDLFGDRLTVLTGGLVAPVPAAVPTAVLALGRDFTDPSGEFMAAYRLGSAEAVVVRPDGHVVWGGPLAGIDEAVRAVTGQPALVTA